MQRIVVASKNPVKLNAALLGFRAIFPGEDFEVAGVSVPSGVSDQPFSNAETLQGAHNRAQAAYVSSPQADFWVGIEGGIEEEDGDMAAFAWVVVRSKTHTGKGKSGTFYLPIPVTKLIKEGMELGKADDHVFGLTNSKQEQGAVGILTGNVITRTELYKAATIFALIPFRNTEFYGRNKAYAL
jgi:inosine/xanthosine triphosphatase